MSNRRLNISSRDRRALLVGVVVIGGGSGLSLGVPALRGWETAQRADAVSAMRDQALSAAAARSLSVFRDSLTARRARLAALDSSLIEGASAAEAGAALSSLLADIAESASVRVTSIQIRGDTAVSNGFARVAVRLVATADVTGLATMVRDIEGGSTLLAVRELSVSQPEPGAPPNRAEALRIDLVTEALARVRKPVTRAAVAQ